VNKLKEILKKSQKFISQYISLRSLRARLFFIILLVGMIPALMIRQGIMNSYEQRAIEQRAQIVQSQLKIIADHLINENYMDNTYSTRINAELTMLSNIYDGRIQIIGENLNILKDTYGINEGKTAISEEVIKCFLGESVTNYNAEYGYIEITTPIVDNRNIDAQGSSGQSSSNAGNEAISKMRGVMLTRVSTDYIQGTMEVLSRKAAIMIMLIIIAVFGLAIVLSSVLTKPFERITKAINEVKAGYSDESISVPDMAETVHIVDAFNQLLRRMKVLDDSRQEFVANVSHELKTPLTSMKVLADSLLAMDNIPVELYQEFMGDIVSEIDRENKIITDLLALVKMDKTAADLNIAAVNINELTELILKRLRPIARKKDVEVVFESIREVVAEVDEVKLTLVISNLVENAIKYNKEQGWVKVILDADHQYFTIEVSDSGMGIPEDSMAQIYERFYRVDKSHSREIGGTGLGLAITKNAVLMHRGSITVTSKEAEGTTFLVKIPLNYIAQS
jgi:signal transduction histidine kinase